MIKLLISICLLAAAGSVYGQTVDCANLLAWASEPADGSYKPFTWQCNDFTAMDINMYILERTGTSGSETNGLSCGCTGAATCLSTKQCASQGCLSDNGGCSTVCGYTANGAVQCSCAVGTSLIDNYRCNCDSFREYPQVGWITATNYLCADNETSTTGIIVVPGTSSTTTGGTTPDPTTSTGSVVPPASSTTGVQGSTPNPPPASGSTTGVQPTTPPSVSTTGVQPTTPPTVSTTGVQSSTSGLTPVDTTQITADTHAIFRLEGSVATFVRTRFVQNLASFLNIAQVRIIINSLRDGSVIVDTSIQEGSPSAADSMKKIFSTNQTALSNAVGYNVLGLTATGLATSPSTPPADNVQNNNNNDGGSRLSGGGIAGIVIGSVIFVALVAVIVFLVLKIRSNNKRNKYGNRRDVDLPVSSSTAQLNPAGTTGQQKW